MSKSPLILIFPGAFHTSVHFEPLVDALKAKGYDAKAVQYAFTGPGAGTSTRKDATDAIRSLIAEQATQGRDVVVVSHSVGGHFTTWTINGLCKGDNNNKHGVVHWVMLCSLLPAAGKPLPEHIESPVIAGPSGFGEWFTVDADKNTVFPLPAAKSSFYHGLSEADQQKYFDALRPQTLSASLDPMEEGVWTESIPKTYVYTTVDRPLPLKVQHNMVNFVRAYQRKIRGQSELQQGEEFHDEWDFEELESGHSPFLTNTKEVADIVAARMTKYAS